MKKNNILKPVHNLSTPVHKLSISEATWVTDFYEKSFKHWDSLKPIADSIEELEKKIDFWNDEKAKWLRCLPILDLYSSGVVTLNQHSNAEMFFDRLATIEIDNLNAKVKSLNVQVEEFENIPDIIKWRVIWLIHFDVIDHLRRKTVNGSSRYIAKILSTSIGGGEEAIRKAIERIERDGLSEKEQIWLDSELLKLNRSKKK